MTRMLLVSMVLASVALAQGRAQVKDGGVAALKPVAAVVDAGVPEAQRGPAPVSGSEVEKLKKELVELRARTADLETRAARAEGLVGDVEKLKKRLDDVRADFDAAEAKRANIERELETRKANVAQANATVTGVLQQLSTGATSNVDAWLRGAEQQYSGNAQKLVSLARAALAQGDLSAARQYLNLALLEPAGP